jgi:dynein intermediate chain
LDAGIDGAAHFGMITSLSTKPQVKETATGSSRPSGLAKGFVRGIDGFLLSVGVDWTVKLWAPAYNDKPLWSVVSHSYDYMCDVKWCVAARLNWEYAFSPVIAYL